MSVMIYRPGNKKAIWGIDCDYEIVDKEEAEKRLKSRGKNKWFKTPLDFPDEVIEDVGSDDSPEG